MSETIYSPEQLWKFFKEWRLEQGDDANELEVYRKRYIADMTQALNAEQLICVRTFREGGTISQVQLESRGSIFAIRRKGCGYELHLAGRHAVLMDKDALLEYIAGLAQLVC